MIDRKALALDDVKRIATAAEAEAMRNGWRVAIAIVDDGGHPLFLVRLDGVTEQEAGAILGAVTALVARGFADLGLHLRRLEFALGEMVVARQDHDAGGGLGDGGVEILGELSHHESAEE